MEGGGGRTEFKGVWDGHREEKGDKGRKLRVQLKTIHVRIVCVCVYMYVIQCRVCVCTIPSEELYEDTDFPEKELSALVASKVSQ